MLIYEQKRENAEGWVEVGEWVKRPSTPMYTVRLSDVVGGDEVSFIPPIVKESVTGWVWNKLIRFGVDSERFYDSEFDGPILALQMPTICFAPSWGLPDHFSFDCIVSLQSMHVRRPWTAS